MTNIGIDFRNQAIASLECIEWEPVREAISKPELVPGLGPEYEPSLGSCFRARWFDGWLYKFYMGTVGQIVFVPDSATEGAG